MRLQRCCTRTSSPHSHSESEAEAEEAEEAEQVEEAEQAARTATEAMAAEAMAAEAMEQGEEVMAMAGMVEPSRWPRQAERQACSERQCSSGPSRSQACHSHTRRHRCRSHSDSTPR